MSFNCNKIYWNGEFNDGNGYFISNTLQTLVVETGVSVENHWPVASHWQTLSHNVVSSTNHPSGIRTHNIIGDRNWLHR
jgi:hypothetical protein